jgi:hypothetical protein
MKWYFSNTSHIENYVFDNLLEKFYTHGIQGLVRENIQNSLDARLNDNIPVEIKIDIGTISLDNIPGLDQLIPRINSLRAGNSYTERTISYMNKVLKNSSNKTTYLTMEDNQTKGLIGADRLDLIDKDNTYNAYAFSKGLHADNDQESLVVRGGSHGVGKIASNAASELNLMYFSNHDKNSLKTIGGNIQLIQHQLNNVMYQANGYFAEFNGQHFQAYKNEDYHEVFQKNTQGLKIIIPFLREEYNNKANLIRAVIDGFLLALMTNKLIVYIDQEKISKDTIEDYLFNDGYYAHDDYEQLINKDEVYTPLYYQTLQKEPMNVLEINDKSQNTYEFDIYFEFNEDFPRGATGIFRNMGMKIEDLKVKSHVLKSYNAVLIPKGKDVDAFLKQLENESHTKLSEESIKDPIQKQNAKYFINQIHKKIGEIIENELEKRFDFEGELETKDILYEINSDFKKAVSNRVTRIHTGKPGTHSSVVKTKRTDKASILPGKKKKGKRKNEYVSKVRRQFGNEEIKTDYLVNTSAVRRTRHTHYESILLQTGENEFLKGIDSGDINISIVDGTGKEITDQLDLTKLYKDIIDKNNDGNLLEFEKNIIKNVVIKNNFIELKMTSFSNINNFKMKFYLEV